MILYYTILYCIILYYIIVNFIIFYFILYYIILYYILYYIILYLYYIIFIDTRTLVNICLQELLWIYIYSLSELFLICISFLHSARSFQTMEKRAKEQMTEVEQAMNKARRAGDLRLLGSIKIHREDYGNWWDNDGFMGEMMDAQILVVVSHCFFPVKMVVFFLIEA